MRGACPTACLYAGLYARYTVSAMRQANGTCQLCGSQLAAIGRAEVSEEPLDLVDVSSAVASRPQRRRAALATVPVVADRNDLVITHRCRATKTSVL